MAFVLGTVAGCLATAHILQAQRHPPLPACFDASAAGLDGQGGGVLACALLYLVGPNPTSLLPGAISLAETVLVKDYWQLACTFGPMTPLQRLMQGFQVLKA